MLDRPPNSPRASAKPSYNFPRRVRKRSNNCDCHSEKQVDRASGKAFALPGYGGLRRSGRTAVQHSLRLKNRLFFFGPKNSHYINIRPPHTAHFLSTHRSVRLHNSLTCMGNRTDFCIDMIAFMGARTDTLQWGQISCSLLYLLLSISASREIRFFVRATAHERHFCCRAQAQLGNFFLWNAITLEL